MYVVYSSLNVSCRWLINQSTCSLTMSKNAKHRGLPVHCFLYTKKSLLFTICCKTGRWSSLLMAQFVAWISSAPEEVQISRSLSWLKGILEMKLLPNQFRIIDNNMYLKIIAIENEESRTDLNELLPFLNLPSPAPSPTYTRV